MITINIYKAGHYYALRYRLAVLGLYITIIPYVLLLQE